MIKNIQSYQDFVDALQVAGFTMGGGNSEGIFSLINWDWREEAPYTTPVAWHTGDVETDPWEWRMRVLDEEKGIAYAKVFFNKSGYITKEWAPYFWAARRGKKSLGQAYEEGKISRSAKKIYDLITEYEALPVHTLKQLGGFTKEEKSAFDRGLTQLQMGMYITMCGKQQKLSLKGELYGWASTAFCTTEAFWGKPVIAKGKNTSADEAQEAITSQVLRLNPQADPKKMKKFIFG